MPVERLLQPIRASLQRGFLLNDESVKLTTHIQAFADQRTSSVGKAVNPTAAIPIVQEAVVPTLETESSAIGRAGT
jgi:hypothetical protein